MLARIPGVKFHPSFVGMARPTTLGRLQREILQNAFEGDDPCERDPSLTILGCASVRREAEWIANEIWRLIREDNRLHGGRRSAERLRFRDIGVLVADTAKRPIYQAHIRAVFEEIHRIPYNIIDLPLAGECRVIEALLLLLALPLGEFTRPELLKILTHPAVRDGFPKRTSTAGATGASTWKSCAGLMARITRALTSTGSCSTGNRDSSAWCSEHS